MGILELQKFYDQIQNLGQPSEAPLMTLIFGDEPFLKRELFKSLKAKIQPENPEFNWNQYELDKAEIEDIEMEIKAYPMFSEFRVVVVEITDTCPEPKIKSLAQMLLKTPMDSTRLVIKFDKWDYRRTYLQKLLEMGTGIDCKVPYAYQIPTWIQQLGQRYQLSFDDAALALFHERVGDTLTAIDMELKKLRDTIGKSTHVTENIIQRFIQPQGDSNIFAWVKTVFSRDLAKSQFQMEHLLQSGESPIACVSLLARHARILLKTREGLQIGLRGPKLAQYIKVPSYFLKKYEADLKHWSEADLKQLLIGLSKLDFSLKSSRLKPSTLMGNWTQNQIG